MAKAPLLITAAALGLLILLWSYLEGSTRLTFEALTAFAFMLFLAFPLFAYGVMLVAKEVDAGMRRLEHSSFPYRFYTLFKLMLGCAAIALGFFILYLLLSGGIAHSWVNIVLYSLVLFALFRAGGGMVLHTIKSYRKPTQMDKGARHEDDTDLPQPPR